MNTNFYSSIARYYQHIFPFNPDQIDFLRQVLPYNGARVLDVGCGIGDLAFALTHFGFPVWAIDCDEGMIEMARNAKSEESLFPVFQLSDMCLVDGLYPESEFNTVISFGNTLVHLLSDELFMKFLKAVHFVLEPEGKFTFQILNYQYILDEQVKALPIIDNEHLRFERNYEYTKDAELIDFQTRLLIKSSGEIIENTVKLNPIRKSTLQNLLTLAGFKEIEFFGSFKSEPLKANSLPLIVVCQK